MGTKINNKFNDYTKITKLAEYVNHDELVRGDPIDIFARGDQENQILSFEFEYTIVNGIVYRLFAKNESAQRTRRLYIKINEGAIVEYKDFRMKKSRLRELVLNH